MKTFLHFILSEDITIDAKAAGKVDVTPFRPHPEGIHMGNIHPDYSMVHTNRPSSYSDVHNFHIIHNASKAVVGHISTHRYTDDEHDRPNEGENNYHIKFTRIHNDHRKSKIGHSLAVAAYKHIANSGKHLHSDNTQSPGGASVWNALRRDPETKHRVDFIDAEDRSHPAANMPSHKIWATYGSGKGEKKIKGINPLRVDHSKPVHYSHEEQASNVSLGHLVLRPPSNPSRSRRRVRSSQ